VGSEVVGLGVLFGSECKDSTCWYTGKRLAMDDRLLLACDLGRRPNDRFTELNTSGFT
jgi:hypothetical protein